LIRGLPVFHDMSQPYKYFNFFVMYFLVLLSGGSFAWWRARYPGRTSEAVRIGMACACLAAPFAYNWPLYGRAFEHLLPPISGKGDFYQVHSAPTAELASQGVDAVRRFYNGEYSYREGIRPTQMYNAFNVRRGVGTIDWYVDIALPERAVPRFFILPDDLEAENPAYQGETWFDDGGEVLETRITSNRMEARVRVHRTGALLYSMSIIFRSSSRNTELSRTRTAAWR